MSSVPVTSRGAEKIRRQLHELKTVDRPRVIKAIAEARAHGDLGENAEYHAAREKQGLIEARIAQLETAMANAQVIDVSALNADGKVVFGATVELINLGNDQSVRYQIVGEPESDVGAGLVSVQSPLARALIGKEKGDTLEVHAPGGATEYEIVEVAYE